MDWNFWYYIISLVALILDFIGVYGIYRIKIVNLQAIEKTLGESSRPLSDNIDGAYDAIRDLRYELNSRIKETNLETKNNNKKAKKYFACIGIGFTLQLAATILGVINNPPHN